MDKKDKAIQEAIAEEEPMFTYDLNAEINGDSYVVNGIHPAVDFVEPTVYPFWNKELKCSIDCYDEFEELGYFFDEEALFDLTQSEDGETRYTLEIVVRRVAIAE